LEWIDAPQGVAAGDGEPAATPASGAAKRPFFAYLHYLELHWPYCPPPAVRGVFTAGYQGRPLCADWRRTRDEIRSGAMILTDEEKAAMSAFYDEELVGLDRDIGELFEHLRERGLWDDTLIVLTADHGEEFFEHGGMAHGTSLYDELIHVPLVLKPPKRWRAPAGARVDALVESRDLLPTFLEAAGAKLPPEPAARSLLRWAVEQNGKPPEFVVSELGTTVAVRTRTHKLIVEQDRSERLYDLEHDPGETRDAAADQPQQVALLERYLRQWRAGLKPVKPGEETLDDETVDGLRALGYLK
jgi:arylsulfatase A-like enzyme